MSKRKNFVEWMRENRNIHYANKTAMDRAISRLDYRNNSDSPSRQGLDVYKTWREW